MILGYKFWFYFGLGALWMLSVSYLMLTPAHGQMLEVLTPEGQGTATVTDQGTFTNYHVVKENKFVTVCNQKNECSRGRVIKTDKENDLALLRTKFRSPYYTLTEEIKDSVTLKGYQDGLFTSIKTKLLPHQRDHTVDGLTFGASGGAVLNGRRVIGIISQISWKTFMGNNVYTNQTFIPTTTILSFLTHE